MRICSGAGCLRVVADDVRFCDECKPQPQPAPDGIRTHTNTDRERYAFLYSSPLWSRIRQRVVREQPMCAMCRKRLTTIVDHIVPAGVAIAQAEDAGTVGVKYAGFYIRTNLQGLCRECHWVKTNEDKAHVGEWPNVCNKDSATASVSGPSKCCHINSIGVGCNLHGHPKKERRKSFIYIDKNISETLHIHSIFA